MHLPLPWSRELAEILALPPPCALSMGAAGLAPVPQTHGKRVCHAPAALGQSTSAPLFKGLNSNASIKLRSPEMSLLPETPTGILLLHR